MKLVYFTETNGKHFMPTSTWPKNYYHSTTHRTLKDETTDLYFIDDTRNTIRAKCFVLAIILIPLVHVYLCVLQTTLTLLNILLDIFNIIIKGRMNFSANVAKLAWDLVKLILAPLLVIALEITAFCGLLFPLNARKIYSSIERAMTNDLFEVHTFFNKKSFQESPSFIGNKAITAPCFQPKTIQKHQEEIHKDEAIPDLRIYSSQCGFN
jgi:hypothetical protein